MPEQLKRIKDAKRQQLDTFYEAADGRIMERLTDGSEVPTRYLVDPQGEYQEKESELEHSNDSKAEAPPNPAVIFIFFGMLLLFGICIAYFFWPKDSEDITPTTTTEVISE